MLVAKIFINERQIDEIHVQNVGYDKTFKKYKYLIRKPENMDNETILHDRELGYQPLLQSVLNIMHWHKQMKFAKLAHK